MTRQAAVASQKNCHLPVPRPQNRAGPRISRVALAVAVSRLSLAVGVAVLTAGCASGDATGTWEATIDTVADTMVVRTLSGRVWETDMALVPEVTIGALEGDEAYLLGSVRSLAVSSQGDIYALDSQVPVIRHYGPDGLYRGDIGRGGGGPGEYERPDGGLAVLSDGRIVVRDPGKAMFIVFSPAGEQVAEWPLPSGGGFSTDRRLYRDTLDRVYSLVLKDPAASVSDWVFALVRMNPDGTVADSLEVPTWTYEGPVITGSREGSTSVNSVPFSANQYWTLDPGGRFAGGVSADYSFTLFRADAPVRIERIAEPVPVDPDERAEAEARATENMQRQYPGWRWNGPPVPETKPPWRGLFVADDGRVWVVRSMPGQAIMDAAEARMERERTGRTPNRFREPVLFDVFDTEGRYLGAVRAPAGLATFPEPVIRGDTMWAVMRDELDVAYIGRYHLEPVATGS